MNPQKHSSFIRYILFLLIGAFFINSGSMVSAFDPPASRLSNDVASPKYFHPGEETPFIQKPVEYPIATVGYTAKKFDYTPKPFYYPANASSYSPEANTSNPTAIKYPTNADSYHPKANTSIPVKYNYSANTNLYRQRTNSPTPKFSPFSIITPTVQPTNPSNSAEVQQLIEDLKKEYSISSAAREKLVQIGPSTISAILPLLRQQDYYVRYAAADTLRRLNYNPKSWADMAYYIVGLREYDTALNSDNFNKLVAAGTAAVDPLILVLKDSNWMKGNDLDTIEVLVAIGKPAVPKLISALEDPVSRESAGIALVMIDDTRGDQAIRTLMKDEGVSLSYYATNYKKIIANYDPYDPESLDILWLGLALEEYGTKEMAEYYLNCGWILHEFGEKWAEIHGYRVIIRGL